MTLAHALTLSAILFSIGLFGLLSRRNVLGMLMSIELLFNAAALNFAAFDYFQFPGQVAGQGFVLFIIAVAAAEAVVGLALVLKLYRHE